VFYFFTNLTVCLYKIFCSSLFIPIYISPTLFDLLWKKNCKSVGCINGRSNGKLGHILGYFILECFSSCFGEAQTGIYYQISQGHNHNTKRVSLPKRQPSQDFFPTCQDLPIEDSHIYSNTSLPLQSSNALDVSSSLRTSNDSGCIRRCALTESLISISHKIVFI